jgi:hypothetical protein
MKLEQVGKYIVNPCRPVDVSKNEALIGKLVSH